MPQVAVPGKICSAKRLCVAFLNAKKCRNRRV